MATNYCTCNSNNLNLVKKDIIISKLAFIYHGYDSARRLELDLLWYIDNYKLDWGSIHHCKLHIDEKAATDSALSSSGTWSEATLPCFSLKNSAFLEIKCSELIE
ncbi:unnamed protein product [Brachionus calyciflorus]|uniref:Uncharacterized protein n=1 Tax=Brachionus calyciflorus TaxID=104777 RepID=A0A814KNI7_9BILA|nr:unnamed protein product [Brachionus calyciflorus]